MKKKWEYVSPKPDNTVQRIPPRQFIFNIFIFNNKIYKQIFCAPIDSLLSPIIATITLQDLEKKSIAININIIVNLRFYFRHIASAVPHFIFNDIINNSIHSILDYNTIFTMEVVKNKRLNFLDLIIIVKQRV